MIRQIKGDYEAKEEIMQKYVRLTKHLTQEFDRVEFAQIPRSQNMMAVELSKLALSEEEGISANLEMEVQKHPSIEEVPTFAIQKVSSWMTPIMAFIQDEHRKPRKSGREQPGLQSSMTPYTKEASPCLI